MTPARRSVTHGAGNRSGGPEFRRERRPLKILVLNWKDLSHPAAGGAEVYVDALARRWAAAGNDVTLLCARAAGQASESAVEGVRVVRRGGRLGVYREARRFWAEAPPGAFDVVLDVVNTRPFLAPRWARGTPVVALAFQVAREVWSYEVPQAAAVLGRYWLEPRWLRGYESVPTLTISESSRQSLHAYGLRNVSVVPVGHEPHALGAPPPREAVPTAAFLGRLAANKRPDHALRAFEAARPSIGECRMWVVGAGPMEERLRRDFAASPVRFFGRTTEAEKLDLLARAHVLLVTSVREGWGLVVTEAAGLGTPAIGYDVPGLRDSLRASNGVVVEPTVEALAAAVAERLPMWAASGAPAVAAGGVAPWRDVAEAVLRHLEEARRVGR